MPVTVVPKRKEVDGSPTRISIRKLMFYVSVLFKPLRKGGEVEKLLYMNYI